MNFSCRTLVVLAAFTSAAAHASAQARVDAVGADAPAHPNGAAPTPPPRRRAHTMASPAHAVGAMATVALTQARPAYAGRTLTELQLVQPVLMADARWTHVALAGALNAEGYTLHRGELDAGIFGEGYVDRRHPHTLVHEAMATFSTSPIRRSPEGTSIAFSLSAGRGFVPFGSDDPMMRPFEKYPVNHHHAQIIERVQVIAAVRITRHDRWVALEGARFNGDEPAGPFTGPEWSRFGDSWATRLTLHPAQGIELSGSTALVISPELRQGGAFDHVQHHLAARIDRPSRTGAMRYLLAEWAETNETIDHRTAFTYPSVLAEAGYSWHWLQTAARLERTDRAEQARLRDPFRAPLGHVDFQILGVTRWSVATVALEGPQVLKRFVHSAPFVEVARAVPTARNHPSAFEPRLFYGRSSLWSFTVGFRFDAGTMRRRMGHYGVLNDGAEAMPTMTMTAGAHETAAQACNTLCTRPEPAAR